MEKNFEGIVKPINDHYLYSQKLFIKKKEKLIDFWCIFSIVKFIL
jgi:hypothetical protein